LINLDMHEANRHPSLDLADHEFASWNEEMSKKYDPDGYHRHPNPVVRWIEGRRTAWIIRILNPSPSDHVLEVGVGAGNILSTVPAGSLTGIDLSPTLLEKAEQRLGNRAQLDRGNAEHMTAVLPSKDYTAVYCSEVLEHVQNPEKVIQQICAISTPEAHIVLSVPNESFINRIKASLSRFGLFRLLFPGMAEHMEDEWHVHEFDDPMLRKLVEPYLVIEKTRAIPYAWMPIRYVYSCRKKSV